MPTAAPAEMSALITKAEVKQTAHLDTDHYKPDRKAAHPVHTNSWGSHTGKKSVLSFWALEGASS